ncbi:DUF3027 domain-containing protein [Arthrobacter sp. H5]|uniref:DUF3027 domain-containing protein n=1 Tax=Arthrobacter sp. H5 TaxID=1267973 RepID=UPI000687B70F|nr:DUF3027 domain-containing protein [Arthrobacter sp. H5]
MSSTEPPESPGELQSLPDSPSKRRAVRRPSKADAVLAAAVDTARSGVLQIAGDNAVGEHLGAFPEAERLVTHRFAADVPGYGGWVWFATLARVPRGKDATVCELGLLPAEGALVAPDWVPWAERVLPGDSPQGEDAAPNGSSSGDVRAAESPEPETTEPSGGDSPVA